MRRQVVHYIGYPAGLMLSRAKCGVPCPAGIVPMSSTVYSERVTCKNCLAAMSGKVIKVSKPVVLHSLQELVAFK